MPRRFITPSQDVTIYQEYPRRNTGKDEVIEVGKDDTGAFIIRGLLQFDLTTYSASLASGDIAANADFYLNLRLAKAYSLQTSQQVEFYMVSQSWEEGTGYFAQDIKNPKDGADWQFRVNTDQVVVSESLTASVGKWGGDPFNPITGSTWWSGSGVGKPSASVTFGDPPEDVRVDVTAFIRDWVSGSTANNGFVIKYPIADEINGNVKSVLRFFSGDTHTIYPPTLEAFWNNQVIKTRVGNFQVLNSAPDEFELFVRNMPGEMATGSVYRLRFGVRDLYPIKSFTDSNRFENKYFLPSGSYLGVKDASNGDFIVPFDSGSLLSADTTSSYFDLKIENMFINRTYEIYVKVDKSWGTEVYNTGHRFKVVRGY